MGAGGRGQGDKGLGSQDGMRELGGGSHQPVPPPVMER